MGGVHRAARGDHARMEAVSCKDRGPPQIGGLSQLSMARSFGENKFCRFTIKTDILLKTLSTFYSRTYIMVYTISVSDVINNYKKDI